MAFHVILWLHIIYAMYSTNDQKIPAVPFIWHRWCNQYHSFSSAVHGLRLFQLDERICRVHRSRLFDHDPLLYPEYEVHVSQTLIPKKRHILSDRVYPRGIVYSTGHNHCGLFRCGKDLGQSDLSAHYHRGELHLSFIDG